MSCSNYRIRDRSELLDLAARVVREDRDLLVGVLRSIAALGPKAPGVTPLKGFSTSHRPNDYSIHIAPGDFDMWFRVDEDRCEVEIVMILPSS